MKKPVKIVGKEGISATVIADSINSAGDRITTIEWEAPRFILSELNTHKMIAKNAASSRAIPVKKMIENIRENPATPVYWGKNQPGMTAKEELSGLQLTSAKELWISAMYDATNFVATMDTLGLHKQIANRVIEPWQRAKGVLTATEWKNFLFLRDHPDAQPEFGELAHCIRDAFHYSEPMQLNHGEWHVPYVSVEYNRGSSVSYFIDNDGEREYMDVETAKMVSASCCAQVSYRKTDTSIEKAKDIFRRLMTSQPLHASPAEHQATPMMFVKDTGNDWEAGVSHMDRNRNLWSAMFKGWIQHRKLVPGEAVW